VPAVVSRFAARRPFRAGWVNEEGGVTFRAGDGVEFIKVANVDIARFHR
jgi:hypothetical protein